MEVVRLRLPAGELHAPGTDDMRTDSPVGHWPPKPSYRKIGASTVDSPVSVRPVDRRLMRRNSVYLEVLEAPELAYAQLFEHRPESVAECAAAPGSHHRSTSCTRDG